MSFENPTPESHSNPNNHQEERTKIGLPPKTAVIAIGVSTGAVFNPGIAAAEQVLPETVIEHAEEEPSFSPSLEDGIVSSIDLSLIHISETTRPY